MIRRTFLTLAALLVLVVPTTAADKPIKVLIITGDHGHAWKETTPFLKELLTKAGMTVDVTETPAKDLTADNLAKYDVLLLNYKDTKKGAPETVWSDDNKKAFTDAVKGGKGLVVYHHASSAFVGGDEFDKEFEKVIAGGWRKQGNHGKRHEFSVTVRKADHPITKGLPAEFAARQRRAVPELGDVPGQRGAGDGVLGQEDRPEEHRTSTSRSCGWRATARAGCARTCWATTWRR